jgi:methanol metabolism-related c-type cytochrome
LSLVSCLKVTKRRSGPLLAALAGAVIAVLSLAAAAQQAGEPAWEEKPYTIVDGKVDFGTYNGYRRYEAYCLRCHGPDGAGSSYAPALADSLKTMSYEAFLETVVYGRKNISASQQSVMPAFGEAVDVMENIDDIYAYLKARADGAIGRGRPERLPK